MDVALKVAREELAPDQLAREFRILRDLRHPGIARAFDFGRLPGGPAYFTMEYIAGSDLEKHCAPLRSRPSSEAYESILDAFLQVTEALAYLHGKGLLHLDIKPSNVVFSGGRAKLIDFGLFQTLRSGGLERPKGTLLFSAPEVFDGSEVDERTDLYSLGVSLYRAFTGRYPITGRTIEELAENHRRQIPEPPGNLPPLLSRVILKLLEKSPAQRFESAGQVLSALRESARNAHIETRPEGYREAPFLGRKRELDVFFSWLDGVQRGDGPGVLAVEGEAGIGKSRLVDACMTEVLTAGAQILPVRTLSARAGPRGGAGGGLRALVEKAILLRPLESPERSRYRFLLGLLGLGSGSGSRREAESMSLESVRARVYLEALELLCERATPLLIVLIEDLHRGDAQLRGFLRWLGAAWPPHVPRSHLGFIVTTRSGAAAGADSLGAGANTRSVVLGALEKPAVQAILSEQAPPCGKAEAKDLLRVCRGNPGLLARALRNRRGRARAEPVEGLASGAVTAKEIGELSPAARSLAAALALLERPVEEDVLKRATLLGALELARAHGELVERGWSTGLHGAWVLEDDVSQAARGIPEKEIGPIRARLGSALLKDPSRAREAARLLFEAGRKEDGMAALEKAAAALEEAGRIDEAASLLAEAIELSGGSKAGAEKLERLGVLEERCFELDSARGRYEGALARLESPSRDRLRLLRRLGGIRQRQGDSGEALRILDEAQGLLDEVDDIVEHLHLLRELAALHILTGDMSRAQSLARRGIELVESRAAAHLSREVRAGHLFDFHAAVGHVLLRQFEYEKAAEELQRGLERAEEAGSLAGQALLLNFLGIAYNQANRLGDALRVYERATELSHRMGDATSLLTIRCSTAAIHARLGEVRRAERMLLEAESLPLGTNSRRARLYILYTRALVARLGLEDARETWNESIRLAGEIPDQLIASSARLFLLENEIQHGRWREARNVLEQLGKAKLDPRLERSLLVRRAYLEALVGRRDEARALLGPTPLGGERLDHAGLWDRIYFALTLLELGEVEEAESLLEPTRKVFDRTKQLPGSLQCALAEAEARLRLRDASRAQARLDEARALLERHDGGEGLLGRALLIPYLEARLDALRGRPGGPEGKESLERASRLLAAAPEHEARWLLDLVAEDAGVLGAQRRLSRSRAAFLKGLTPEDRRTYLERDHRSRLGLGDKRGKGAWASKEARSATRRYETLLALRRVSDLDQALDLLIDATEGEGGALFLEDDPARVVSRGKVGASKRTYQGLRSECLRVGSGKAAGGWCSEVKGPGSKRIGVLFLARGGDLASTDVPGFLDTAGVLIGEALARLRPAALSMPSPLDAPSGMSTRTRTLSPMLLLSEAPRMKAVVSLIQRTRESKLPVLLTGESGSGKDYLARWIHSLSPRKDRPFVAQDCSAIPAALLEAEIFGYEAGAFTGAGRARPGFLFQAQGGTFYIDNVDSLLPEAQSKLVRVLETGAVRPLGSSETQELDVRLIASSQRDLRAMIERGEFRRDLYFRLSAISIEVPPLRERAEDVPLLVAHFCAQMRGHRPELTPRAMEALKQHSWPGNIRELESVVRRLALTSEASIDAEQVARVLGLEGTAAEFPRWTFAGRSYQQVVEEVKRTYLLYLFETCAGDMEQIARRLGLTKRNAYLRYAQLGIRPQEIRAGAALGGGGAPRPPLVKGS